MLKVHVGYTTTAAALVQVIKIYSIVGHVKLISFKSLDWVRNKLYLLTVGGAGIMA